MVSAYPTAGLSALPSTAVTGTPGRPGSTSTRVPAAGAMPTRSDMSLEQELAGEKLALDQYVEGLSQQLQAYRLETQQMVAAIEGQTAEAAHQQELAAARAEGVQIMATGGRMSSPPAPRARRYASGGGQKLPGLVYPERRADGSMTYYVLDANGRRYDFGTQQEAQGFVDQVYREIRANPTASAPPAVPAAARSRGAQDVVRPTSDIGAPITTATPTSTAGNIPRSSEERGPQTAPQATGASSVATVPTNRAPAAAAPAAQRAPVPTQVPVTASRPTATGGGQVYAAPVQQQYSAPAPPPEPEPIRHPFAEAWGQQLGPEYHPDALPLRQSGDGQYQVLMNGLWTPLTYEEADAQSQAGNVFVVDWDHPLNAQFETVGPKGGVLSTPKAPSVATFDPALAEPEAPRAPSVATFAPEPTGPNAEQQANSARYPSHIEATPDMYPNARPFVAPAGYYQTPDTFATPPPARNRFGRTDAEQEEAERMAREGRGSVMDERSGLGATRRARGGAGAGRASRPARRYQDGGDTLPPGVNAIVGEGRDPAGPGLRPELIIDPEAIRQGLVTMTTGASGANLPPDAFVIPLPPRLYDDAAGLFQPFDQGVPVARNPDGQTFTAAAGGRLPPPPRRLAGGGILAPSGFGFWNPVPTYSSNAAQWASLGPAGMRSRQQALQAAGAGPDAAEQAAFVARVNAPPPVEAQPWYGARGGRRR